MAILAIAILLALPAKADTESKSADVPIHVQTDLERRQELWVKAVEYHIIECESQWHNVKIIDSNGYYSYGILQFQKSTWDDFSKKSGIVGDPMIPKDSIKMAEWAIMNGYGTRWTCWKNVPKKMQSMPN